MVSNCKRSSLFVITTWPFAKLVAKLKSEGNFTLLRLITVLLALVKLANTCPVVQPPVALLKSQPEISISFKLVSFLKRHNIFWTLLTFHLLMPSNDSRAGLS